MEVFFAAEITGYTENYIQPKAELKAKELRIRFKHLEAQDGFKLRLLRTASSPGALNYDLFGKIDGRKSISLASHSSSLLTLKILLISLLIWYLPAIITTKFVNFVETPKIDVILPPALKVIIYIFAFLLFPIVAGFVGYTALHPAPNDIQLVPQALRHAEVNELQWKERK